MSGPGEECQSSDSLTAPDGCLERHDDHLGNSFCRQVSAVLELMRLEVCVLGLHRSTFFPLQVLEPPRDECLVPTRIPTARYRLTAASS